jgi:hypothetical protein
VDKIREKTVHYRLPCGRVISSTGLPEGLEVEKLEKILQGMLQNQPTRHVLLKNKLADTHGRCFGSGLIESGSRSRFLMTKILKKFTAGKNSIFFSQKIGYF